MGISIWHGLVNGTTRRDAELLRPSVAKVVTHAEPAVKLDPLADVRRASSR
jgi:hypothetical protein